jgi:hypothetical protein
MNSCTSATEPAAADDDEEEEAPPPPLFPSGRSVSHSVRNWPMSLEQAGSYSAAGMASRT